MTLLLNDEFYALIQSGNKIVVMGYGLYCGKTELTRKVVTELSKNHPVNVVTNDVGIYAADYNEYVAHALGTQSPSITMTSENSENAVTVYDKAHRGFVDYIIYITPNPMQDRFLGITDDRHHDFTLQVTKALEGRCRDIVFITEAEATLKTTTQRDIQDTDWLVLRELEQRFLKDTPLGRIRSYIRNAAPDVRKWSRADKF